MRPPKTIEVLLKQFIPFRKTEISAMTGNTLPKSDEVGEQRVHTGIKENFTPIPNKIIENLAGVDLSGSEFRILLVVIRRTLGWHKERDSISVSQFEQETKLSRSTVNKALKNLKEKGILLVYKRGLVNMYELQNDIRKWIVYKHELVSKRTPTSVQMETGCSVQMEPYKRNIKENKYKEKVSVLSENIDQKKREKNIQKLRDIRKQLI